jgi:hypothetical protein
VCQVSIEGESDFSCRALANKNNGNKKEKQKNSKVGSPFLLTFLAKQKSESRRATAGGFCYC